MATKHNILLQAQRIPLHASTSSLSDNECRTVDWSSEKKNSKTIIIFVCCMEIFHNMIAKNRATTSYANQSRDSPN